MRKRVGEFTLLPSYKVLCLSLALLNSLEGGNQLEIERDMSTTIHSTYSTKKKENTMQWIMNLSFYLIYLVAQSSISNSCTYRVYCVWWIYHKICANSHSVSQSVRVVQWMWIRCTEYGIHFILKHVPSQTRKIKYGIRGI